MPSRKRATHRRRKKEKNHDAMMDTRLAELENRQRLLMAKKQAATDKLLAADKQSALINAEAEEIDNQKRLVVGKLRSDRRKLLETNRDLERLRQEMKVLDWLNNTPDCEKPFATATFPDIRNFLKFNTQSEWDDLEASGDAEEVEGNFNSLVSLGFLANEECPADFDAPMQPDDTFQSYFDRLKTTLKWIDSPQDEDEQNKGNEDTPHVDSEHEDSEHE